MNSFKVEGGVKLSGDITPQGAKNEALQILCATLLTSEKVIIENVPEIIDVLRLIDLLKILGLKIDYLAKELEKIINEYPKFVVEVRGQGFLRGLKLFDPVNEIQNELKKNKVLFVAAAENVLRLLPPLTVSIEEIDIAISALRKVACKGIK